MIVMLLVLLLELSRKLLLLFGQPRIQLILVKLVMLEIRLV